MIVSAEACQNVVFARLLFFDIEYATLRDMFKENQVISTVWAVWK